MAGPMKRSSLTTLFAVIAVAVVGILSRVAAEEDIQFMFKTRTSSLTFAGDNCPSKRTKFGDMFTFVSDLYTKGGSHLVGDIAGLLISTDHEFNDDCWEHMQVSTAKFHGEGAPKGVLSIQGFGKKVYKSVLSIVGGTEDFVFASGEVFIESHNRSESHWHLTFKVRIPGKSIDTFEKLNPKEFPAESEHKLH